MTKLTTYQKLMKEVKEQFDREMEREGERNVKVKKYLDFVFPKTREK
jgi:hypothetical protein